MLSSERLLVAAVMALVGCVAACGDKRVGPAPYKNNTIGTGGQGGASAGGGNSGANGGDGGAGETPTLAVSVVIEDGPWELGQQTTGIVADDDGNVLIQTEDRIYQVSGTAVSDYLNTSQAAELVGLPGGFARLKDMDQGPDGATYILLDMTPNNFIIRSDQAEQGSVFRTLPDGVIGDFMSIATLDRIGVVALYDELWEVGPDDTSLVYERYFGSNCATEDLAVHSSGEFLYLRGCNASPITRGTLDGEPIQQLISPNRMTDPFATDNFNCVARDPAGGYYTLIRQSGPSEYALLHVDEGATDETGFSVVTTVPSLHDADLISPTTFGLGFCAMTVSPGGTVYLQSFERLWRLDPIEE